MGVDKQGTSDKKLFFVFGAAIVLIALLSAVGIWWNNTKAKESHPGKPGELAVVDTVKEPKSSYDVIVAGTDPEGVAAAVSASRNGLKVLFLDGNDRKIFGGLMTLGWLNSLDMNYVGGKNFTGKPDVLNKGLFSEWYKEIEGDSFDVVTAANAFNDMVKKEKNIDVLLGLKSFTPIVKSEGSKKTVTGMKVVTAEGKTIDVAAKSVIDATQDADVAAAAGAPFTFGREDIGDKESRMAVTLVFRLKNVTPEVWKKVQKRLSEDGLDGTDSNEVSAWGYVEMQNYPAVDAQRAKMRGLNIGRQNDGSILINALQIFGINGLDPKSRAEAFEIGKKELPNVLAHMKKLYPEFEGVELDGTAPELYVRETRHIQGEYRLSMIDVLENRDQWDRVGFGSYPVDIQRTAPTDNGAVVSAPEKYAIPFRSLVPLQVDGILVVSRSASYDTLPHGSARVIPVGMAAAESAGIAAKIAIDNKMTFREMSASKEKIALMQTQMNKQGMDVKEYKPKAQAFMENKSYPGLQTAISLALATGGYKNDFELDKESNIQRMVNLINGSKKMKKDAFKGDASGAIKGITDPAKKPLTLEQASYTITQAVGIVATPAAAMEQLISKGLLKQQTVSQIADKQKLTNGDTYMMIKDLKDGLK